ncbi:MAG TPA: VWA domain-containing protein [Blastocatellia bacterium]|nr:VWA domain-containing protein [Blastocatellia bacterium]
MNDRSHSLAAFSLVVLTAGIANSQSGRIRNSAERPIRLRVEEVLLPVTLHNTISSKLPRLDASDFKIVEDGAVHQVTSVARRPASVVIVIDNSNTTMSYKDINLNMELALKVVPLLGESDRVAALTYGDKVEVVSGWTTDKQAVLDAIKWKCKPGIKSHFYDALLYAGEHLLASVPGPRIVILISDGVDSFNADVMEKARMSLNKCRATLYFVCQNAVILKDLKPYAFGPAALYAMFISKDPLHDDARQRLLILRHYAHELEASVYTLDDLARESGGQVWNPATLEGFKGSSDALIKEVGAEYLISYISRRQPNDEDFHPVQVSSTIPGVEIRTRRGVYANSEKQEASSSKDSNRNPEPARVKP